MDLILQEMFREINTISAKSSNFKIFLSPSVTSIPGVKPLSAIRESSNPKSLRHSLEKCGITGEKQTKIF